ncbi:AfsR/SARP family transcriptional regulator [Actinomadura gamaensis]|uniref:Bacterial transcriptional activator domain-containing protein n=1 Tax=Actinomadura gamaensis TaxID=1763541 RepID=A0ABV9UAT9_9ACTN
MITAIDLRAEIAMKTSQGTGALLRRRPLGLWSMKGHRDSASGGPATPPVLALSLLSLCGFLFFRGFGHSPLGDRQKTPGQRRAALKRPVQYAAARSSLVSSKSTNRRLTAAADVATGTAMPTRPQETTLKPGRPNAPEGRVIIRVGRGHLEGPQANLSLDRAGKALELLILLLEYRAGLTRLLAYDLLWPEANPATDRECFHGPLRELRGKLCQALGLPSSSGKVVVQRLGTGYRLNPALITSDLWEMRDAIKKAAGTYDQAAKLALLLEGLAAIDDQPASFDARLRAPAKNLRNSIIAARPQLADLETDTDSALTHLDAAIDTSPTTEGLYRSKMQLLAHANRPTEVHGTYGQLCEQLSEHTPHAHPSTATTEFYRHLCDLAASQPASSQSARS